MRKRRAKRADKNFLLSGDAINAKSEQSTADITDDRRQQSAFRSGRCRQLQYLSQTSNRQGDIFQKDGWAPRFFENFGTLQFQGPRDNIERKCDIERATLHN